MDLINSGGGLDTDDVTTLIEATVNSSYIVGAFGLGYTPVSQTELDEAINDLGLDTKVDKVTGALTTVVQYSATGSTAANPYLKWTETNAGSGARDAELGGDRIRLNGKVRFLSAAAELPVGINWDGAGQTLAIVGAGVFSVTTSSANVEMLRFGVGIDYVMKCYSNLKSVVVVGQSSMTVPIFAVKRSDLSSVIEINDVARISAATISTVADLKAALVTLGIFGA